ncbi:MAG: hypothetical protein M3R10_02760, partial [Verrucomicrobiota bacterium]|nr:hypothetical protein [Verrucomicrobiota bacterium]
TRLLLSQDSLPNDLNLRTENRLSALAVWSLLILLVAGTSHHQLFWTTLIPLAVLLICNHGLYRLFLRRGGLFFSLGAIFLHWLHYFYSSATFVALTVAGFAQWRRTPSPACLIATAHRATVAEG